MRRREDGRGGSPAGPAGFQGVRKPRLASRKAAHSSPSDICGPRSTTPSPVTAGICSDKLTVRKNAMMQLLNGEQSARSGNPALDCVAAHQISSSATGETVGDSGRSFKSGAGAKRGDCGSAPRNQDTPSGAGALDRYRLDFLDKLLERNRAAPIDHLPRELLGARG